MTQAQITQLIRELVTATGCHCDDVELRQDPLTSALIINIAGKEVALLIGCDGEGLTSLRHLVQRMIDQRSKDTEHSYVPFTLDINNHYSTAIELLKKKVLIIADRVRNDKKPHHLDPMTPYERLVVHALLSPYTDLATHSEGEGEKRHIIIDYKEVPAE